MSSPSYLAISLIAFAALGSFGTGCEKSQQAASSAPRVIELTVTEAGFVPAEVQVKAGQPVKLQITRKVERTCVTDFVIKDYDIEKSLPLNEAAVVEFTPTKPGRVRYACAMDMIAGVLVVE